MTTTSEVCELKKKLYGIRKEVSNMFDLIVWNHKTQDFNEGIPTEKVVESLKKIRELAK